MNPSSVRLNWEHAATPPAVSHDVRSVRTGDRRYRFVQGDNLLAMSALRDELRGQVTLAYLDPPFLTGRRHTRVTRRRMEGRVLREVSEAFDDRWSGIGEYLNTLRPRLEMIRETLAPHGSAVIHVDPKTSHYVKVLCDELFGPEAFASEIIWRYRRWPAKTPNFQRVHDVLLRYVRDPAVPPRFNQLYEPLAASTLATWGKKKQRAVVDDTGQRRRSSTTPQPSPGAPMGDVWEIGILAPVARERTGYPTQKPEALIERLVLALSAPGDLVLDPYVGSGTTLAVAARTGRRALGIDQGAAALDVTRRRMAARELVLHEEHLFPSLPALANAPNVPEYAAAAPNPRCA